MVVAAGGGYIWHTKPSTRPIVVQQGGTESWTMTCERPTGQVLETRQVTVARGASVTAANFGFAILSDIEVFFVGKRGGFAGGTDGNEAVDARFDLKLNEFAEIVVSDGE